VKIGRLQVFNNWSPYMVADFENKVWIGLEYFCSEGDELWEMTDQKFIAMAIDELTRIGIIAKEDVEDAVRIKVKKAYPSYFGSYYQLDTVKQYLDSIENLFCIGRNGQHRYNNMDHSMLTAIEAVAAIHANSTDKRAIWSVNTETAYHETKN
jgi:protoporphyrinogen oxidase